jgi:hypothetical protein
VNTTGHVANPAVTSSTGIFAALGGLLRVRGSGVGGRALNLVRGSGAPAAPHRFALATVATLCALLGAFALSAAPALAEACPNEQLRAEQPFGLGLPDCRAYEQVSPLDKEGADILPLAGHAAASGEAVMYYSTNAFDEPLGASISSEYLSRRGPAGWSTQNITPPLELRSTGETGTPYLDEEIFTPELTEGILFQTESSLGSEVPAGYNDLFVVDFAERSYRTVTSVVPPNETPYSEEGEGEDRLPFPVGASSDLSHVVFQQRAVLTPGALERLPGAEENLAHLYEWVDGHLSQVDIAPEGTTLLSGAGAGAAFRTEDRGEPGGSAPKGNMRHAVSEDGLRVFFPAVAEVDGKNVGQQLFVRENPEQPQSQVNGEGKCTVPADACTIEVSASQRETPDPHGPQRALFQGASADGSRVFFTSNAELTENAKTGEEDNAANLYEYELATGKLTDLTVDDSEVDGAQVEGVAGTSGVGGTSGIGGVSEDGSYVYFYAQGDLAGAAVPGKRNLYLYHDGQVTFIATVTQEKAQDNEVRLSADGTHIAFFSETSPTGYDNHPVTPVAGCGAEGCPEIYLFDASTESLVCASCDPHDEPPVGPPDFGEVSGDVNPGRESFYMPRNLSADGSRLFFDSPDPLLPGDNNGLDNVYEYENGEPHSISDGSGDSPSYFRDASENGNNAFFTTADGLVPQDKDGRVDVYDARVEGGFPVLPSPPPCENADSCHGPESPQPSSYAPTGTATFSGAGNPAPAVVVPPPPPAKSTTKTVKCKKGEVRKHNKCVKRSKTKKRAKKSAHGKKGSK